MTDINSIAAMAGVDPEKVRATYDALRAGSVLENDRSSDDEIAYARRRER
jgi:hypothetical protein